MIKLLFTLSIWFNPLTPADSIGLENINGKMFIIHKVDEKETLYAISRRYGVSVDAILEFNKGASNGLEIGEIVKVPYTAKSSSSSSVKAPNGSSVHKVAPKETMYSITKMYGVTQQEIMEWNDLKDFNLSVGQELVIKKKSPSTTPTKMVNNNLPVMSKKGVHTVAQQETLYSIARQYGITPEQLKEWNNLQDADLKVGQVLNVAQPERGLTIAKKDTVKSSVANNAKSNNIVTQPQTPVEPKKDNEPKKDPEPKKDVQPVKANTEPPVQTQTIKISESVKNSDEIVEAGVAELIEGTEGNRKYLALHRTAPVGTILKIKNSMNNREVFVRVMGKLPDTAVTDKVIIRISKSAYDRLGAIDQRFRVEVTYYK